MSKVFERFTSEVTNEIEDLTDNHVNLTEVAHRHEATDADLVDMFFEGVHPREAARNLLFENGFEMQLSCWSTECDECVFDDRCPHVN